WTYEALRAANDERTADAAAIFQQIEANWRLEEYPTAAAIFLRAKAYDALYRRENAEAIRGFRAATTAYERIPDIYGVALAQRQLGIAHLESGDPDLGAAILNRVYSNAERMSLTRVLPAAQFAMGRLHEE